MSTQRISDKVAAQLRGLVQEQRLQPGDRLPAERALAVQLGVSRTALREAIAQLASQGLLTARVGGGTYVAEPAARARQALDEPLAPYLPLFQGDPEYRFDVLEIRHALEGATAWHAALRATDEDRTRIAQAFQTMMDAHGKDDPTGEAEADAAFHLSIAEASHNLVLLQAREALHLGEDLLATVRPAPRDDGRGAGRRPRTRARRRACPPRVRAHHAAHPR
ncbi:hypothetical protein G6F22_017190 [Rhizopus arrhizus]|nr:hypothetical protein G6F22_017190 [Rhizopus arrhizus]